MKKQLSLLAIATLFSISLFAQQKVQLKQVQDGTQNGQVIQRVSGESVWDSLSYNVLKDKPTLTSGTVTSVGLTAPSIFEVTGSPVTTAGTLGLSLESQSANTVFAAPNGSTGTPTFRALVATDIPNLAASKITSGVFATARLGTGTASGSTVLYGDGTWGALPTYDLGDLDDVSLTSLSTGQLLRWSGTAWANWTPNYITLSSLSGTSPITYNNSTGAIGVTTANLVAGSGITLSGTLTNRIVGSGNVTIALDAAGTIGTDTTVSRTVISGDISSGVVTIALGATPKTGKHVGVYINGVRARKAAVAVSGNNVTITNSSLPYPVTAGDEVEVDYTK